MDAVQFAAQVALGLFCMMAGISFTSRSVARMKKEKEEGKEPKALSWRERAILWPKVFAVLFLLVIGPTLIVKAF